MVAEIFELVEGFNSLLGSTLTMRLIVGMLAMCLADQQLSHITLERNALAAELDRAREALKAAQVGFRIYRNNIATFDWTVPLAIES